jgi:NADH-quinone oxidoreductase subunit C
MSETPKAVAELYTQHFGERVSVGSTLCGITTLEVAADAWLEVCRTLRDHDDFAYEQLTDLCGLDYLGFGQSEWESTDATSEGFSRGVESLGPGRFAWAERPESEGIQNRFAVVAHLISYRNNRRLRLRCFVPSDDLPILSSLVEIWSSANWYEREAFDLFGIVFEGHPDLRRILTDYGFTGHPFRKDFPLIGNVAVRYDSERERVVYEPVDIDPRVTVPRVLRDDTRYRTDEVDAAADAAAEEAARQD